EHRNSDGEPLRIEIRRLAWREAVKLAPKDGADPNIERLMERILRAVAYDPATGEPWFVGKVSKNLEQLPIEIAVAITAAANSIKTSIDDAKKNLPLNQDSDSPSNLQ
ncbi:hypothetical protein LCGC14_2865210, partial [marine sediment metagenome]